jgi:agmatinase
MSSTIIFALCISAQILPILSHRSGHAEYHEMPHLHQTFMGDDFIDVTTNSEFFGLTTFANLPYVNCLNPDETEAGRYDIAILGAPFDTVSRGIEATSMIKADNFQKSVTGRPGARFGPAGIRRGSQRMAPGDAWNIYTGRHIAQIL